MTVENVTRVSRVTLRRRRWVETRLLGVLLLSTSVGFGYRRCIPASLQGDRRRTRDLPWRRSSPRRPSSFVAVWKRGAIPGTFFMNLGGFAALMIVVYAVYPVVVFLFNGLSYTPGKAAGAGSCQPQPSPDRCAHLVVRHLLCGVRVGVPDGLWSRRKSSPQCELGPLRNSVWLIAIPVRRDRSNRRQWWGSLFSIFRSVAMRNRMPS